MLEAIFASMQNLQMRDKIRDDDFVDQMHHFITVFLFGFFGMVSGLKEYMGSPLDCWLQPGGMPNTLKHYQEHANSYCWLHKLYHFPDDHNLSKVPYELNQENGGPLNASLVATSDVGELNFYRWITVVFFAQALMFKLPKMVWEGANECSGSQMEKMVSLISDSSFKSLEDREKLFCSVAEYVETWLKMNRNPFMFMKSHIDQRRKHILQHCMLCVGANTGNYLSSMYLVVKVMFLVNVILQFFIVSAFLEFDYWPYGRRALKILRESENRNYVDNVYFPRVALCHFQVRGAGSWIQCVLTINMVLEKIFIVEWFWLLTLMIVTIYSLVSWLSKILSTSQSIKFISKYLSLFNVDGSIPQEGQRTVASFVRDYLGNDGIFLLRILATNTNDVALSGMVGCVWRRYITYENKTVDPKRKPKGLKPMAIFDSLKAKVFFNHDPEVGEHHGSEVDDGKSHRGWHH